MTPPGSNTHIKASVLAAGTASGAVLALDAPLSFWGGFDSETGKVSDRQHPQLGEVLTGKILVMESGRGSSSASSVLAEAIRTGTAPAGIVLKEPDPIIALGAVVAAELYALHCPVVVVAEGWDRLRTSRALSVRAEADELALVQVEASA